MPSLFYPAPWMASPALATWSSCGLQNVGTSLTWSSLCETIGGVKASQPNLGLELEAQHPGLALLLNPQLDCIEVTPMRYTETSMHQAKSSLLDNCHRRRKFANIPLLIRKHMRIQEFCSKIQIVLI